MALRILLLAAGNSVHTVRWATAFAQRGCTVHLVTQHPPAAPPGHGVNVHVLPHRGVLAYVRNGPALRRLANTLAPDVVNAHYATGYGTLARWCTGIPLVLNVWGSDVFDFPKNGPLHTHLMRSNLRRAGHVVSTSNVMAERTTALCPGLRHMHVVPFGVDTSLFKPRAVKASGDEVVIGTVKTLAPKYGVDTLIDAYALLRNELGDTCASRLRVIGDGPQKPALIQQAKHLRITEHVQFVDAVPHAQVPRELQALDVFSALSRDDSESFGVAVVEASATGLPVVVSDAGGLPEVVSNGATGWVVPRDNAAAAAAKLKELALDAGQRKRMGEAGRMWVKERYEWSVCVDLQMHILDLACRSL